MPFNSNARVGPRLSRSLKTLGEDQLSTKRCRSPCYRRIFAFDNHRLTEKHSMGCHLPTNQLHSMAPPMALSRYRSSSNWTCSFGRVATSMLRKAASEAASLGVGCGNGGFFVGSFFSSSFDRYTLSQLRLAPLSIKYRVCSAVHQRTWAFPSVFFGVTGTSESWIW